ncbi:serine/threonine protein kinase [Streptomyces guryensis]|uniref:Protein kinase n=1 Tax=Streptomyces guryensis TaxID=2886947 RepID=A0A9Q3Z6M2_9ACTN|nr:serine/threonine-protein kinase [Streptomyces guryensis]MCD9875384.1 protein kinase [Streptomyces guryensis]
MGSGLSDTDLAVLGARPLTPDDPVRVGRYRLAALLGAGGMGRVYLGWAGGRFVAVKVVRPELAGNEQFRRRFARELATLSRLDAEFTAALVDAEPDSNRPWLATEYVPGVPLEDAVQTDGPLPVTAAWRLAAGVATALGAIHGAGVVHRDLKPSNVILDLDGPKVIDFGVAYAADLSQLTVTGQHVGTPCYMAPEQARTGVLGPPADVFALGGLLTFAVTGKPPFGEGTTTEVLFRVVHEPPDLTELADVDRELHALVARCLEKDPEQRPDAAAVVAAVGAARAAAPWPQPLLARIEPRRALTSQVPVDEPESPGGGLTDADDAAGLPRKAPDSAVRPSHRRRTILAAAAAVTLLSSAAVAAGELSRHNGTAASPNASARNSGVTPAVSSPSTGVRSSAPAAGGNASGATSGHPANPAGGATGAPPSGANGGQSDTHAPADATTPPGQSPDSTPTHTQPKVAWIPGSVASSNGCTAWMNYRPSDAGGFTQALLESWGNDCKMNYFRGPESSSQKFTDPREQQGAGTLNTDFYWDGPGVYTWVCVWRVGEYKQNSCGGKYYVQGGTYHTA